MSSVYARAPLRVEEGIPVFSERSDYTENYETIAGDHLRSMERDGTNPFIAEERWVEMEESTLRLVRAYAKPGARILDAGVGLARILSRVPELDRYGMDISFAYLREARAKGIDVCYARVEDMPYAAETFDVVLATDILEHVLDVNLCAAKMLAVLKRGGLLIARVPYREDLSGYLAPDYPYQYVHLRSFDEHSLRLLFERVLGCEWVEATFAAHHAYGGTRLKYRVPRADNAMRAVLARMERSAPRLYARLAPKLVLPMEINALVRKR